MTTCRFVASDQPRVLAGRHLDPCVCDGGFGCLECPETHCVVCGRAHAKAACVDCLNAARSDLEAIGDLCDSLPEEAATKGVQSEAMMLLGPSADPEAWQHTALSAVMGRLDAAYLADCRDELHPLFVLGSWEQVWREHLDHLVPLSAVSVWAAAGYLNMQLGYMADQLEPPFDEFARDLRACRAHLEDVLRDGIREERGQVPCVQCGTRLVKVYTDHEPDDHWRCPHCHRIYTDQEYARAQHFHMAGERADRFVKVSEALGMIDRPEQSLRTWMAGGKVKTERDPKTGALLVWWPDVREMHRNTPTRKRRSA